LSNLGDLSGALIAEKYELLRLLGRGGMGAVYEARNITTLKRCAVKVLLTPELAGDEEVVRRFFREARASGVIESEHVVAAFDSGIDAASRVYYVMECLQGEDLQQLLRRVGALDPVTAAKIILQASIGLVCAHALGIVHRDVKPANLFLSVGADEEIKVKILDFGVAKVKMEVFHEGSHSLTRTGSLLGTPLYMSPEQMKRASDIDESTDVWSLGVVLFECLTGKVPWGKVESVGELMAAVLTLKLPLVQDYAPWVHPELAQIVHRALSRDPSSRMRSVSELRDSLRSFSAGALRLKAHELKAVSDAERSRAAVRLELADTLTMPLGLASGAPVVRSVQPRIERRGQRLAVLAAVVAVVGASGWKVMTRSGSPAREHDLATQSAAMHAALTEPLAEKKRFQLEVGPQGVSVLVDGAPVLIQDGHISLEGSVGSVHHVTVARGAQSHEDLVAITGAGVIPARLVLPGGPAAEQSRRQPAKPRRAPAGAASSAQSDGGLSIVFE